MTDNFAHLHVHTEYSMLDGMSKLEGLIEKAAKDGMTAIGITDHGNMFGVPAFYKLAKKGGIKPIIGTELYQAKESVDERPKRKGKKADDSGGETDEGSKIYYHLTALAENNEGYKNLCKLSSRAYSEGFYYKPRADWDMLSDHSKGMIVTSGCLGGLVNQALLRGDTEEAMRLAGRFQDIYGKDNFFIELQDHGIPEQHQTNPLLVEISRKLGAPLLLTNDSHYTHQHDSDAHDAMLCVGTGSLMSDPNRFKFHGDQHYLKPPVEMRSLFPELPEASDNTLWVAERCNVELDFETMHLPQFPLPEKFKTDTEYLKHLVYEGAKVRWGDNYSKEIQDRIDYELNVIDDMGFSSYFLITWDLVRHANEKQIAVGPGRGSAAGCAVAYTLRITDLDPIEHDLLFERFLNPSRISMPDIDMDFDTRGREEMIRYTSEKYGEDRVVQIITYSEVKGRSAIRDAARVLDLPIFMGDKLAKAMPPMIAGRDTPLWACFEESDKYKDGYANANELRNLVDASPDHQRIIDIALGLEGARRGHGIHAAAVVIGDMPITDVMPTITEPDPKSSTGFTPLHTQYDMHAVEEMGFLKMDFLGLKNLDVITDALSFIKKNHDVDLKMADIPLDDPKTYELLSEGKSIGVFQLESTNMRALLQRMQPDSFQDVAAVIALYRPGPMAANMHNDYADRKNGRQKVSLLHEDAKEILGETQGLMIYQEQMMFIAQKFAGYDMAAADTLRKVCGKKLREPLKAERIKFIQGCVDNGYTKELGEEWFDMIEPFADYAFNKSHAYGYGLISCWTAWLKANYPVEYMCSLLIHSESDIDKMGIFLKESKSMGVEVLPPSILKSEAHFVPVDGKILFGLSSVKSVGEKSVLELLRVREERGGFKDIFDVVEHVPAQGGLKKNHYEALIKVGAFDVPRHSALEILEELLDSEKKNRAQIKKTGMTTTLFDMEDANSGYDRWDSWRNRLTRKSSKEEVQVWEKEMLGIWVSSHPLDDYAQKIEEIASVSSTELNEVDDGSVVVMAGIIEVNSIKTTKKGDAMSILQIADLESSFECVVFPRTYKAFGSVFTKGGIVVIQGRVQDRNGSKNIIIEAAETIEAYDNEFSDNFNISQAKEVASFSIFLHKGLLSPVILSQIKKIITTNRGDSPVEVLLDSGEKLSLGDSFKVNDTVELREQVIRSLGPSALL